MSASVSLPAIASRSATLMLHRKPRGGALNITDYPFYFFLLLLALFVGLIEIGFRLEYRRKAQQDPTKHSQIEETRNQIAVLLSLLLGFTLSMALSRYD